MAAAHLLEQGDGRPNPYHHFWYLVHELRMAFTFLNGWKKESNKKFRKWVKDINSHLAEENIHVVLTVSALGVGGQSSSHA